MRSWIDSWRKKNKGRLRLELSQRDRRLDLSELEEPGVMEVVRNDSLHRGVGTSLH